MRKKQEMTRTVFIPHNPWHQQRLRMERPANWVANTCLNFVVKFIMAPTRSSRVPRINKALQEILSDLRNRGFEKKEIPVIALCGDLTLQSVVGAGGTEF
jgi:hypothetical protein